MKRKIITIRREKRNGCSIYVSTCRGGTIGIMDGKAEPLGDHYYDGPGDCLSSCPTGTITFEEREADAYDGEVVKNRLREMGIEEPDKGPKSQLRQWSVQIKLLPMTAPCYRNCNLLIVADCTAFTYGNLYNHFIKNHMTVIGRPKLDNEGYSGKLAEIIEKDKVKMVTVPRMKVPCCRGMEMAARKAMKMSDKNFPWRVVVVPTEGKLLLDSH